jgi:amidase
VVDVQAEDFYQSITVARISKSGRLLSNPLTMMKRRKFISQTLRVSGAVLAAVYLPGCQSKPVGTGEAPAVFDLEEKTIADLQAAMENGSLTARSLAGMYLKRIEEIDRNGPTLRSVIETNPDALVIAEALDAERKSKGPRGPLHGIPVLIKDNIDTADKMHTSAGSLALANSTPLKDAFLVQRLREAGAVILGKTNLSEWANFRSTRSSSGWSSRGGQTRNPYVLDRSPCGSSSGSGVAVAANLCAVAVGTETDGSIICPSTMCGIVGIKPTLGLVSRNGIIPISHSQDTAGPMARTVTDAAVLLNALVGYDPADAASQQRPAVDFTQSLDANGLQGARLGVARYAMGVHEKVDAAMEAAFEILKKQGATLIDLDKLSPESFGDEEFEVLLYEFKADLNAYLAALGENVPAKSLEELITFNEKNKDKAMPFFGQELFEMAQKKGDLSEKTYLDALAKSKRLAGAEGIDASLRQHQLDAIVAPSDALPWSIDLVSGDHYLMGGKASYSPAAVAGYPNITVPAGFAHELPIGISFYGTAFSEPVLIKLAYAFEQASKMRRPPKFLPTVS